MRFRFPVLLLLYILAMFFAQPALVLAAPVGEPVLDPPTLHSLGVYWFITEEHAHSAKVEVEYRKIGTDVWKQGQPLFRAETGPFKDEGGAKAPDNELTVFDGAKLDLRLRADSPAINAGERLPGFNDDYRGAAPDLGAYEFGAQIPHYGPRPEKQ